MEAELESQQPPPLSSRAVRRATHSRSADDAGGGPTSARQPQAEGLRCRDGGNTFAVVGAVFAQLTLELVPSLHSCPVRSIFPKATRGQKETFLPFFPPLLTREGKVNFSFGPFGPMFLIQIAFLISHSLDFCFQIWAVFELSLLSAPTAVMKGRSTHPQHLHG